ncbi:MAG TPA: hypothetical protein VLD19_12185 [Chitinophagaceae bacterium]|nr:hypothetical protein [Chitinophagaceae bacterium]
MKTVKTPFPLLLACICGMGWLLNSCSVPVRLTASWSDRQQPPARFSKIAVLSIGKNLENRRMAEDNIRAELILHGFNAVSGIDEFGPEFARMEDSLKMRRLLTDRHFDGVITVRVLNINEHDRWVPGTIYYGPAGFYRGFYGYYYRVWSYYGEPGYKVTDVEVLLESNLYKVQSGTLLWSGQSKAFTRNPTPAMAARYARNIVEDIISKKVIVP